LIRLACQVIVLVDAVERRLDDAGVLPGLDLLLQPVSRRTAGYMYHRGYPVERGEKLVKHRARRNDARPADDAGSAVTSLPGLSFLAFERRDAAVGEADSFGAVVGGEHDDRIVKLPHVLKLLEYVANVVIHLLHAGFVDAPVL